MQLKSNYVTKMAYTVKAITSQTMQIRGRYFHVNQPAWQSHHEPETFHLSALSSSYSGNATFRVLRHLWRLPSHEMSKGNERRTTILGYFSPRPEVSVWTCPGISVFGPHVALLNSETTGSRTTMSDRGAGSPSGAGRLAHENRPVSAAPRE